MENFKKYGKMILYILMVITDIIMILFGLLMILMFGLLGMMVVIEDVDKDKIGESMFIILCVYFTTFFMNKIIWHFLIYRVINQYKHDRKFGGNITSYQKK